MFKHRNIHMVKIILPLFVVIIAASCEEEDMWEGDEWEDDMEDISLRAGSRSLEVKDGGKWKKVCCDGSTPKVSSGNCAWKRKARYLVSGDKQLWCKEMDPGSCKCQRRGNRFHGENGPVKTSVDKRNGGRIFPDSRHGTCLVVRNKKIVSVKTSSKCPDFRL